MTIHEVGRESSKRLFNLPSLVFKARHLSGSAFCNVYRLGVSEQAVGGIPQGFGMVVEDKHLLNLNIHLYIVLVIMGSCYAVSFSLEILQVA